MWQVPPLSQSTQRQISEYHSLKIHLTYFPDPKGKVFIDSVAVVVRLERTISRKRSPGAQYILYKFCTAWCRKMKVGPKCVLYLTMHCVIKCIGVVGLKVLAFQVRILDGASGKQGRYRNSLCVAHINNIFVFAARTFQPKMAGRYAGHDWTLITNTFLRWPTQQ
jgi:hypothetical protein